LLFLFMLCFHLLILFDDNSYYTQKKAFVKAFLRHGILSEFFNNQPYIHHVIHKYITTFLRILTNNKIDKSKLPQPVNRYHHQANKLKTAWQVWFPVRKKEQENFSKKCRKHLKKSRSNNCLQQSAAKKRAAANPFTDFGNSSEVISRSAEIRDQRS